jgi:diguanylate cyclase (GGDEF)-like protein
MRTTAPKTSSPPPAAAAPNANPRVLVVDDSRVIRSAIKKILDSDFEVVLAESGDVAWSFLARERDFKMLVTDIEMPGIDGYELICRVRGSDQAHLKDLPILTITGAEDEQTKQRAFACGATDFITKPIDGIQLKARAQSYTRLDQSARDLAEKATQLEEQAINDPLTGLRSRRFFLQRGAQDLAFCIRNEKELSVVRFDIDRYKELYRQHGDDVGDRILTWLAGIVSTNARVEDTVARVAGAKFAVLATATGMEESRALCQRLRDAIRSKPFLNNGAEIKITLSFGIASISQDHAHHIEPLLNCADERVARATIEGGDRVCVSVLGEVAPSIEELVLDLPPPSEAAPTPAPTADNAAIESLSAPHDEIELPPVTESVKAVVSAAPVEQPVVALDPFAHLVSVDKALQLIASGQGKLLDPYLKYLSDQLRPLLDLIARRKR